MERFRIASQLKFLVGISLAVFAAVVSFVVVNISERAEDSVYEPILAAKDLTADVLPPPLFLVEAELVLWQAIEDPRGAAAEPKYLAQLDTLEKGFNERITFWRPRQFDPALRKALDEVEAQGHTSFTLARREVLGAVARGDVKQAQALMQGPMGTSFDKQRAAVDALVKASQEMDTRERTEAAAQVRSHKLLLVAVGVVGALLVLALGLAISTMLNRQLQSLTQTLRQVATGDFTVRLHGDATEMGQVREALQATIEQISKALAEVGQVASGITSNSDQIARAAQQFHGSASELAVNTEESAATIQELTSTSRSTSENASQASRLAQDSQSSAQASEQVMTDAVRSMNELVASSEQISEIVSTIEEIAFQTNLLALNAAVEAARAGDHGRGFAVVAAEVRTLAQRASTSAKDVKGIVLGSLSKIDGSVGLVRKSAEAFSSIARGVGEVSQLMAQIAASTREEATAIEMMSRSVTKVDMATQRNASETERLTQNASHLDSAASRLTRAIAQFKVAAEAASASGGGGFEAVPSATALPAPSHPAPSAPAVAASPASAPAPSAAPIETWKPTNDSSDFFQ